MASTGSWDGDKPVDNARTEDSKVSFEGQFDGLEWIAEPLCVVPGWTVEPDLKAVERAVEAVFPSQKASATFLGQGALNKLYNVRIGEDEEVIMRVSLPVDPVWKTLSEVATVNWVRRNTLLPLPRIFTSEISRNNAVDFEWILMSKVPGKPLADAWRSMTFPAKQEVVRQLVIYSSTLFKRQLHGIGNIFSSPESSACHDDNNDLPEVKRIVSLLFFWNDRIRQDVPRGPFRSSKDWLAARLMFTEHDCLSTLARYDGRDPLDLDLDDEDILEEARRTLTIVNKLKHLLNSLFPSKEQEEAEPSMLVHDDLHDENILVDGAGALTGVLDWECVSALPLWKACDYPSFLMSEDLNKEPDKAMYERSDNDEEGMGILYWEEKQRYEKTMLRQYFLDEMRTLEPRWVEVFEASQRQRDFDLAMQQCPLGFSMTKVNNWIDDVSSGKEHLRSLHDRLWNHWNY